MGHSNPVGTILSVAMMLRHLFGWEADAVERLCIVLAI
ncbi:isocitrate/isopropylmalate family dehydrogenase [Tumebacillus sp. DT12]|uniref:Isocitrate/isopropylmalate family dehydrogenase n=1 Tax=Tumebacillus lacus TaxID=2995335 RepID=A0ABT3X311_9BACL|nr:isocitrate/isopropylmalate family dehydrogenase [Tumebacillus lacus]MCX7571288.1 isocitrate/isopropylmalate family dehydrogenase [Tumebacillus lacus]